jgi:hypothetical protein
MDPNEVQPFEYTPPPSGEDDETAFYQEDLDKDIQSYRIAMAEGPQAQTEFAQNLSARTDVTDDYKMAVLKASEDYVAPHAFLQDAPDLDEFITEREYPDPEVGDFEEVTETVEVRDPRRKPPPPDRDERVAEEGDVDLTGADPAMNLSLIEARTQEAAAGKQTPKEAKSNLETYINEFKTSVAKHASYEGMSDEERGWLLLEAGLRVMAGQSPHAIVNIAEGLKGVAKEFAADEKAKRLYNRQIGLSAVKYGMDAMQRDRTQLVKDAREFKWLTFTKPHTDPKTGQSWERGEALNISTADILSGNFKDYPLGEPSIVATMINADATVQKQKDKLLADLKSARVIGDKAYAQLSQSRERHRDALRTVKNNTIMVGLLDSVLIKNIGTEGESEITGFTPWVRDKAQKVSNALGRTGWFSNWQVLEDLKSTNLQQYNTRMRWIANRMIKEMLGEGSKNISNIDRELAEQIVGLVKGSSTIWTSPEVLHENLQRIRGVMVDNLVLGYNTLSEEEGNWQNRVLQSGVSPYTGMKSMRQRFLEERPGQLKLGRKAYTFTDKSGSTGTVPEEPFRPLMILQYRKVIGDDGKLIKGWDELLTKPTGSSARYK